MSTLSHAAREEIKCAGFDAERQGAPRNTVSIAGYIRRHFDDGRWHGDTCGCPDDRCIGHHHAEHEECGCLPVLLEEYVRDATSTATNCQPWCEQHEAGLIPEVCTTRPVVFSDRDSLWMSQGADENGAQVILQVGYVDLLLSPQEAKQVAELVEAHGAGLISNLARLSDLAGTVRA